MIFVAVVTVRRSPVWTTRSRTCSASRRRPWHRRPAGRRRTAPAPRTLSYSTPYWRHSRYYYYSFLLWSAARLAISWLMMIQCSWLMYCADLPGKSTKLYDKNPQLSLSLSHTNYKQTQSTFINFLNLRNTQGHRQINRHHLKPFS